MTERPELEFLDKNSTFVDVGAYKGAATVPIAKEVKKVLAVEAYFKNFCKLVENIQAARLFNVIPLCLAVWDKKELVPLYFADPIFWGGRRFHRFLFWKKRVADDNVSVSWSGDKISYVQGVPLDEIFDLWNIRPSVIKIDVNGSEFKVLEGLRNTMRNIHPIIFLITMRDDIRKRMLKYGYDAEKLHSENDYIDEHGWLCR